MRVGASSRYILAAFAKKKEYILAAAVAARNQLISTVATTKNSRSRSRSQKSCSEQAVGF
jgi:hypothetical protein